MVEVGVPIVGVDELVGIVTERDISLIEKALRDRLGRESLQVRDACVQGAYIVDLSAPLGQVLAEMAERHIGSALVVKRGKLAGIFTSNDACHHFGLYLGQRFGPGDDDVA